MGGAGINAEDAVDAVAAALTGGSKISISYDDPNNEIEISTTALNASEVNTRIDTRVGTLLPTVTAGEASIDDGDEAAYLDIQAREAGGETFLLRRTS